MSNSGAFDSALLPPIVIVAGPTASGKSARALALAEALGGEIVNGDSVQVYRGFDIGTAKPTPAERSRVPHHLFDVCDPGDPFDAARWRTTATEAIAAIVARGRLPIVVGGTGLYLRALVYGLDEAPPRDEALRTALHGEIEAGKGAEVFARLCTVDPEYAARIGPGDARRIVRALEAYALTGVPYGERHRRHGFSRVRQPAAVLAPDWPRAALDERIAARTKAMFQAGLIDEVRRLLADPAAAASRAMGAVGYARVAAWLKGSEPGDEAALCERVTIDTRQYARRQLRWLRYQAPTPRWVPGDAPDAVWVEVAREERARVAQEAVDGVVAKTDITVPLSE